MATAGVPRPLSFPGGWRWILALPSFCLSVQPLVCFPLDPDVPPWLGQGLSRQLRSWKRLLRSPSQLPKVGAGGDRLIPIPRASIACWKGWMWRSSAGKRLQPQLRSGRGWWVQGDPNTPWDCPHDPPAPSSRLRGGLGGVSHSPGAVEGQAESCGRQQQGQGGQQPPPRVSPTSCGQLHLWGHRGALEYPRPYGDGARGLGPCPECPHHTGCCKGNGGSFVPLWVSQGGFRVPRAALVGPHRQHRHC